MSGDPQGGNRYPNLFLVGAPKCGTTSMAYYLGQHPDVFVPVVKEVNYFGADLTKKRSESKPEYYLNFYKNWSFEQYALDASAQYFVSRNAASEIYECNPDARILIMVRNPLDAVYSQFFQNRFDGVEPITEFEAAITLEEKRAREGRPPRRGSLERLLYSQTFSYSENISRYRSVFGSDQVCVIVFDDFMLEPRNEFIRTCQMLGLNAACSHTVDFSARNTAKRPLITWLGHIAAVPPPWAGAVAKPFLSKTQRLKLRNIISRINTLPAKNPPMKPETRRILAQKFAPEVEWLSGLLDRDLTHWLNVDE